MTHRYLLCTVAIAGCATACAHLIRPGHEPVSTKARLAAIRRAQVWVATDVRKMDLKAGPTGPGSFRPNETVSCDYIEKKMEGSSPKFECALTPKDEIKVKYGRDNGEVYAEVAATRLLWALGFGADRMYPVRIECRGCPPDPLIDHKARPGQVVFELASIERKMRGKPIEDSVESGWAWPELDLVDEKAGGAPRAQRDALKLLAVLIQHTDSKPAQQRLLCLGESKSDDSHVPCAEPFMMINDLGMTFGRANFLNRASPGSVNFENWSHEPVWVGSKGCVGNMTPSQTGTIDNPAIGEGGRKFLADLLVQLSDAQLRDLFEVARFPERSGEGIRPASVDEWTAAFAHKRTEIVSRSCP